MGGSLDMMGGVSMFRLEKISLIYLLLLQACYITAIIEQCRILCDETHTTIAKVHVVRLKFMTLCPANRHVLGTEMMKFGLGGIWTNGGTINYGGGISNPHRNHGGIWDFWSDIPTNAYHMTIMFIANHALLC